MQTIWKTQLRATDVQEVELPVGAEILCAREQYETICIWYRCDPHAAEKQKRLIAICGTGHDAPDPDDGRYLGTVPLHGGTLIFHVFEKLG